MSRYLDPKADVVFYKIFSDHSKLLISFLNALLPLPSNSPIVSLTYLRSEQAPVIPEFQRAIAGVKCTDSKGNVFIVEIQMSWTDHFKQRLLFETNQIFVKQLEKKTPYKFLQPVYGLCIIAEIYDSTTSEWYQHYPLVRKNAPESSDVIDHLQLIFIELPKFPIQSPEEKKLRLLWLRFLCEIDEKTTTVSKDLLEVPEIAQAIGLTEESAYTPGELTLYESYWDQVSREKTLIMGKYAEGKAEGKAEGEELATQRIAQKQLERGASLEQIMEDTGLSREKIEEINADIKRTK